METPEILVYTTDKKYHNDFIEKIKPSVRKKFGECGYKKHMFLLAQKVTQGIGSYSRVMNTISVSLESLYNDITVYSKYTGDLEKHSILGFAIVMAHEFIHYCIDEENDDSGIKTTARENEAMTYDMTFHMVKELNDLINSIVYDIKRKVLSKEIETASDWLKKVE